jgi:hypothetical protein
MLVGKRVGDRKPAPTHSAYPMLLDKLITSHHITPRRPVRKEITAIMRKTKNKIWAMPAADPAIPLKPRKAATIAMIKNIIA